MQIWQAENTQGDDPGRLLFMYLINQAQQVGSRWGNDGKTPLGYSEEVVQARNEMKKGVVNRQTRNMA
jgi:hypothetical protein